MRLRRGQILIGGSAANSPYVLVSRLPPRTYFYTVVPDSVLSPGEKNSGPSVPLPCPLWGKRETKTKGGISCRAHFGQSSPPASRRGPSTGSVAQGQDRRASDESPNDNLSLPLAVGLVSCVVWSVVDRQTNKMKGTHESKFLQFICFMWVLFASHFPP